MKIYDQVKDYLRPSGNFGHGDQKSSKLIKRYKKATSSLKTKKELGAYIKYQQIDLLQYWETDNRNNIDEAMFFLESYYAPYLNKSLPISDRGKQKVLRTLTCLEKVRFEFHTQNTFLEKVLWPLLYPEKHKDYSIHQADYLYSLHTKWVNEFIPSHPEYNEIQLLQFLISYNYNTYPFFNYLTNQVDLLFASETDNNIKIAGLNDYLNRLNRILLCINHGFTQDFPTIKSMLKEWLEGEIKSYTKEAKKNKEEGKNTLQLHKLEIDLSVDQVAYITKLFYSTKVITNKSQLDMLQTIKTMVRTKGSADISFNSLNNKYYNVEDKTKETVRQLLLMMLKQIS